MIANTIQRVPARTILLLAAFMLLALLVRTIFAWETVFGGEFVRFTETDAWYHLRLIDNLLPNFFYAQTYDPYLRFPGGQNLNVAPGLDVLIASLALLLGAGSPDSSLVERVAALMPALLGAAMVLPVYALGRSLFSVRAGLFAAALIAILPGDFLVRTTLGFTDHHAAEVFFCTLALALFVRATQADAGPGQTIRAIAAGLGLGLYLAMWSGGALFIFALTAAVWIGIWQTHAFPATDADIGRSFLITVGIATAMVMLLLLPYGFARYHLVALAGAAASVAMLMLFATTLKRTGQHGPGWFAFAALITIAGGAAIFWLAAPELAASLETQIRRLTVPTTMVVPEAAPLYRADLPWPNVLFRSFGLVGLMALFALIPALGLARRNIAVTLLLTWFAVSSAAMIGQVRFGYYVAAPVALLAGLGCDWLLDRWPKGQPVTLLLITVLLFVPCAQLARAQVEQRSGPSDDWHEALVWMRENTPEPLESDAAYFESYAGFTEATPYPFPDSAYGVLSWWDPGYWIIRIARRIPHANPTQAGLRSAAQFFLETDESIAKQQLLALGSRYVIASSEMLAWQGPATARGPNNFDAMIAGTDADKETFFDTYMVPVGGGLYVPRTFYYPKYYQTMAMRLYLYGGQAAQPDQSTFVATFVEQQPADAPSRKILTSLQPAPSYAAALEAVRRDPDGRTRIVSTDPFRTCIPLAALATLHAVHQSPTTDERSQTESLDKPPALVSIFEFRTTD